MILDEKDIPLDKKSFLLSMLANLTSSLENVVGLEEAEGFFSIVGATIGEDLSKEYRKVFGRNSLTTQEIANVLVDLKRRIDGGFSMERITDETIILVNDRCPFGDKALGRKSLCMMTSNVFGSIASDAAGQANVELRETIASGSPRCRVVVYLNQLEAPGLQYFASNGDG